MSNLHSGSNLQFIFFLLFAWFIPLQCTVSICPFNSKFSYQKHWELYTTAVSEFKKFEVSSQLLNAISGDRLPLDVCTIHSQDRFERAAVTCVSAGFLGSTLTFSEKLRCLGPERYTFAGESPEGAAISSYWYQSGTFIRKVRKTLFNPETSFPQFAMEHVFIQLRQLLELENFYTRFQSTTSPRNFKPTRAKNTSVRRPIFRNWLFESFAFRLNSRDAKRATRSFGEPVLWVSPVGL